MAALWLDFDFKAAAASSAFARSLRCGCLSPMVLISDSRRCSEEQARIQTRRSERQERLALAGRIIPVSKRPRALFLKSSAMEFAGGRPAAGRCANSDRSNSSSALPRRQRHGLARRFSVCQPHEPQSPGGHSLQQRARMFTGSRAHQKFADGWRSAPPTENRGCNWTFIRAREYGGLVIEWPPARETLPLRCWPRTTASTGARSIARVAQPAAAASSICPKANRFLRLPLTAGGLHRIEIQPFDFRDR